MIIIEHKDKKWVKAQDIYKKASPKTSRVSAINTLQAIPDEHKIKMAADKGPPLWWVDEYGAVIMIAAAASRSKAANLIKHVRALFEKAPTREVDPPEPKPKPPTSKPRSVEIEKLDDTLFEEDMEWELPPSREEIERIVSGTMNKWNATVDERLSRLEQTLQALRHRFGSPSKPVKTTK